VRLALATAVLAAATSTAVAQDISLNRPGSGARAAGMGNAFIAVSDDGTAASWNPAGLSQLRKPEFSLVHSTASRNLFLEGYRTRDESAAFTALSTVTTNATVEFASAAVPFSIGGKPVTLQAGWRRLYQLSSDLNGDMREVPVSPAVRSTSVLKGRPESALRIDNASEGNIDVWSLAGAVRFTNRLSLGFSVDLYRGGWEDRGNTSEDPGVAGPTDFSAFVETHEVSGNNLNFGLLLAYPSFRVGLVYHAAFWGDTSDDFSIRSSLIEPVTTSLNPGGQVHFPRSVGLGVAWLPRPLTRLALDFTYDEWTEFLLTGTVFSPDRAVSGFDGRVPELSATRDTVSVNAGLEKLFPVKGRYVPLRLGASYEPQGARDTLLRDGFDHVILAAGTGLNTNSFKLDVALEYRWGGFQNTRNLSPVYLVGREQEFSLPPGPEAQGTVRIQEWRLKVSLIYRVTDTEKLKGVLKKVFGS
jgi:long-subunit fatty acid transport protein